MICCDVCAIVLGKTRDEPTPEERLFFIGIWEICKECRDRYAEQIFDDVKNKRYRKN